MRILIADHRLAAGNGSVPAWLVGLGYDVVSNPFGRRLSEGELIALAGPCVGVIAGSEQYTETVLMHLPALQCISRVGGGVDNIDREAATRSGVEVCTTPDAPTEAVAEFTLGLIVALVRGISQMDRQIRAGRWEPHLGVNLSGLHVGVVGLGRIGRRLAELLTGRVEERLGYDVQPREEWAGAQGVRLCTFEQLLSESDVVSLHVPSMPDTFHLINARALQLMRPGAFLVNTSRGHVIHEESLYAALQDGHLRGAALDVFSEEPYQGPLRHLDNVILTAHAASHTTESRRRMEREAAQNLHQALQQSLLRKSQTSRTKRDTGDAAPSG